MSGFAQIRSLFGSKSSPRSIHPEQWPEPSGKTRVLIENPDGAELWSHADVLRDAGYEVAMCAGPTAGLAEEHRERTLCPLIAEGHCPLVEGADVVISTTYLADGREIVATLSARNAPALVVEGTSGDLAQNSDVIGDAVQLKFPVLPQQILAAVEHARSTRAID